MDIDTLVDGDGPFGSLTTTGGKYLQLSLELYQLLTLQTYI